MSKKKGKKKSCEKDNSLEKIILTTAILNLICEIIKFIKELT